MSISRPETEPEPGGLDSWVKVKLRQNPKVRSSHEGQNLDPYLLPADLGLRFWYMYTYAYQPTLRVDGHCGVEVS